MAAWLRRAPPAPGPEARPLCARSTRRLRLFKTACPCALEARACASAALPSIATRRVSEEAVRLMRKSPTQANCPQLLLPTATGVRSPDHLLPRVPLAVPVLAAKFIQARQHLLTTRHHGAKSSSVLCALVPLREAIRKYEIQDLQSPASGLQPADYPKG